MMRLTRHGLIGLEEYSHLYLRDTRMQTQLSVYMIAMVMTLLPIIINMKDSEHAKRAGASDATLVGDSRNIYPCGNEKFPAAREFNEFFANKGNKVRIQIFLKQEFSSLSIEENVKVIYSVCDKCEDISSSPHQAIKEYECNQYYCSYMQG